MHIPSFATKFWNFSKGKINSITAYKNRDNLRNDQCHLLLYGNTAYGTSRKSENCTLMDDPLQTSNVYRN